MDLQLKIIEKNILYNLIKFCKNWNIIIYSTKFNKDAYWIKIKLYGNLKDSFLLVLMMDDYFSKSYLFQNFLYFSNNIE